MSALTEHVVDEHVANADISTRRFLNCACNAAHLRSWDDYAAHVAEVTEAAVRESIARDGLGGMADAIREAIARAPRRTTEVNLATAYWDGYRAAGEEVADLLEEPALAARIARTTPTKEQ